MSSAIATCSPSQWLFPVDALLLTPSITTSNCTLHKELYDRARGVEFLFRLGSSLNIQSSAMFTAATWFHRFYMRYALEDYHRQDVAACCIFVVTKTEECGRKLRDVARVCQAKVTGLDMKQIAPDSPEVNQTLNSILFIEEVLLEGLCFDFVVGSPHANLVDLFDAPGADVLVQEHAWSIAHDSYRTPLCVLFTTRVIAVACYVLAQKVVEGPQSSSLDVRISSASPSASLPTPPTHKPPSPDSSRFAIEYFSLSDAELAHVSDVLNILLQFYCAQDSHIHPHLAALTVVPPPTARPTPPQLYPNFVDFNAMSADPVASWKNLHERTPSSSHGGNTPANKANGRTTIKAEASSEKERLELS